MRSTQEWLYRPEERRLAPWRKSPPSDLWWFGFTAFLFEFFTPEGGADRSSRNIGNKSPLPAAYSPLGSVLICFEAEALNHASGQNFQRVLV
jgi:hypothetical protein